MKSVFFVNGSTLYCVFIEFFHVIRDSFPVSPLHTLIIPKRHVETYFDLNEDETNELATVLKKTRHQILELDNSVKAFNVGINAGEESGQTIFHCHVHLIPRRKGDVQDLFVYRRC